MSSGSESRERGGFEGELTALGLPDLIQLEHQNRFSGCIAVQYQEKRGLIFVRDGEIVHAEQGNRVGEEAFREILAWPAGRFSQQSNVATTRRTIQKDCQHLLLDAHRLVDERHGRGDAAVSREPPARPRSAGALMGKLREIPGVEYVVVLRKDGARVADESYEGEVLAGQALFLALAGRRLGAIFRTGDVLSAAVEGASRHLLLYASKDHFLGVLVAGENPLGPVEAQVRRAVAGGR